MRPADALATAAMSIEGHTRRCMCQLCWAQRTGTPAPVSEDLPRTRAELLAALDRAFDAGVRAERERAAREAAELER